MTDEEFDAITFRHTTMLNTVRIEGTTTICEVIDILMVDFQNRLVLGKNNRWYPVSGIESEYVEFEPDYKLCVQHGSIDYPCDDCGDCEHEAKEAQI